MSVDWSVRRAFVMESDDWGVCAWCPDIEAFEAVRQLDAVREYWERLSGWVAGSLETPDDMERLFGFLENYTGCDGRPANIVSCYGVANPDYDAIREAGLSQYHDIFLDEGVPSGWERGDLPGMAKDGMRRGVWVPEFHTRLHHAQPRKWLASVREGSPHAAAIFDHNMFQCEERRPEYEDMTPSEQAEWIVPAIQRMQKLFNRAPKCAVNSDATIETERIWRAQGLQVRMCRNNVPNAATGDPGREQLMGFYQADSDMIYLSRNCFLEPLGSGDLDHPSGARAAYEAVLNDWRRGVPAVCSCHRKNYVSFLEQETENGYSQATWLYDVLTSQHPDIYFMTSWEVAQMYRNGASVEVFGDHAVVRNWTASEQTVSEALPEGVAPGAAHVLTSGAVAGVEFDEGRVGVTVAPGDYLVELTGWS